MGKSASSMTALPELRTLDDAIEFLEHLYDQLVAGEVTSTVVWSILRHLDTLVWLGTATPTRPETLVAKQVYRLVRRRLERLRGTNAFVPQEGVA
jgi:hypothetical protein